MYQSGFAEINGAKFYYEVKGDGEPLLLVHGAALDSRMWEPQFEEFSKHFKTIRFDFAGSGKSSVHDQDFDLVEDMKGLLEFLEIEKAHLLGLSVGGNLSMDFAIAYPEMVDKLITVSTGLLGWSEFSPERQEFIQKFRTIEDKNEMINFMCKGWLAGPFRSLDEISLDLVEKYSEMLRDNLARENGKGKIILPKTKTIDLVGNIMNPTLIVSPDIDFPEFKQISNYLHEKINHSELVVIPNTAHMITMEKAEDFNHLILNFLLG